MSYYLSTQLATFSEHPLHHEKAGDEMVTESCQLHWGTRVLHGTLLKIIPSNKYSNAVQKLLFQNKC